MTLGIWGDRTAQGRLIMSRDGEILTLVGPDDRSRYIPLLSFGSEVRRSMLSLRFDYSSAMAAAERLDTEAITALEAELIGELTRLTPVASHLVGRRHCEEHANSGLGWVAVTLLGGIVGGFFWVGLVDLIRWVVS
jgi:hypothetical protein